MALDKQKWLRITLLIIALDDIVVGIGSILLPNFFGNTPLGYIQISITIGLFAIVIAQNPNKNRELFSQSSR